MHKPDRQPERWPEVPLDCLKKALLYVGFEESTTPAGGMYRADSTQLNDDFLQTVRPSFHTSPCMPPVLVVPGCQTHKPLLTHGDCPWTISLFDTTLIFCPFSANFGDITLHPRFSSRCPLRHSHTRQDHLLAYNRHPSSPTILNRSETSKAKDVQDAHLSASSMRFHAILLR